MASKNKQNLAVRIKLLYVIKQSLITQFVMCIVYNNIHVLVRHGIEFHAACNLYISQTVLDVLKRNSQSPGHGDGCQSIACIIETADADGNLFGSAFPVHFKLQAARRGLHIVAIIIRTRNTSEGENFAGCTAGSIQNAGQIFVLHFHVNAGNLTLGENHQLGLEVVFNGRMFPVGNMVFRYIQKSAYLVIQSSCTFILQCLGGSFHHQILTSIFHTGSQMTVQFQSFRCGHLLRLHLACTIIGVNPGQETDFFLAKALTVAVHN